MAKFKRTSNSAVEFEAKRWLLGNEAEIVEFLDNKFGFAINPLDPTKGVLYGLSHDLLTGQQEGQVFYPVTSGDWIAEFSQAGKPIFLGFTDDEMQGKFATPTEPIEPVVEPEPVVETPADAEEAPVAEEPASE